MTRKRSLSVPLALALTLAAGCATGGGRAPAEPPAVRTEMRGLWVATVANIDWPTRKGLTATQQKIELLDILDRAKRIGFNTIVLQVRPASDALYASSHEPWAAWLTGTQGENPGYDPLAFAIAEAHARGLQLHAWINPFRAGNTADTAVLAASHVFRTRRDLVRVYGGHLWMDPGDPDSQERSLRVITDIASRYDVDGIHADDYFYPYQIRDSSNRLVDFPDDLTYGRYGAGGDRGDWRRANIDRFVERMYAAVHAVKPDVAVGLSPFGIWRPGYPQDVAGLDAFATIYADSRKWLQRGWVDYFVPQLYWAIGAPQQSFPQLLDWWLAENTARRHVWPGLAAYRMQNGAATAFPLGELEAQMRIVRQRLAQPGEILYNTKSTLYRLDGAIGAEVARSYTSPAVVPAYRWIDSVAPAAPVFSVSGNRVTVSASAETPRWWLVREHVPVRWSWRGRVQASWTTRLVRARGNALEIDGATDRLLIQAIDAAGNVSAPAEWRKP